MTNPHYSAAAVDLDNQQAFDANRPGAQPYPMQAPQPGYPQQYSQQQYPQPQYPQQYSQQQYPQQYPQQYMQAPMAAPINIVVQNTNSAVAGMGGLVRTGNRSRGTAAILAFFLGGLGVHKFYLGQTGLGILYLLLCWTFLPSAIAFLEGIGYLVTSEHAFDMKYNARLS